MALELQLAHCNICKGYYSSTVLNTKDLSSPEIIDHYFYHGEPWFTLDKKTFDLSVDHQSADVKVVDFEEHLKYDHQYCTCAESQNDTLDNLSANLKTNKKVLNEYVDQDIYFYDLYITYNNIHQDLPARQAI
ncbi:hypothetical protein PQ459_15380 [Chryseobacterium sp. KACC 21268]|nr:hypothetical protein PQ459_15380 [Chryseobacterium sp. KACC 21268]